MVERALAPFLTHPRDLRRLHSFHAVPSRLTSSTRQTLVLLYLAMVDHLLMNSGQGGWEILGERSPPTVITKRPLNDGNHLNSSHWAKASSNAHSPFKPLDLTVSNAGSPPRRSTEVQFSTTIGGRTKTERITSDLFAGLELGGLDLRLSVTDPSKVGPQLNRKYKLFGVRYHESRLDPSLLRSLRLSTPLLAF